MDIAKLKNNWEYYDDSYVVTDEVKIHLLHAMESPKLLPYL